MNVTSVNDAPTAAAPAAYVATEQTLLNLAGTGLVVGDVDALGGNVTVTLSVASGVVNATAGATGVVVSNSGTATVRLDGTLAQVNALLSGAGGATLTYLNGSDIPPASDTLTLAISDNGNTGSGGPLSANVNATINITAVDDAPMNTVAGAQTTAEDTPLVFSAVNGTQVSVGDADAGAALIEVTLTVANGSVTLASVGGLAFQAGANGTATMIVRGTIASINAALDGMIYLPGANYSGSDVLTITTNDLGNTGIGGPLSDTDMVAITITAVNDAPVLTGNAFLIRDGATVTIGSVNVSATDVDNVASSLVFNVGGITHGHFELVSNPGAPITNFTQAEIAGGLVQFVHDGSGIAPTFSISVSDGTAATGPVIANIGFNALGFGSNPTSAGGGAGSTGVTPPLATPASSVLSPINVSNPIAQGFVRGPTEPPVDGGDDNDGEAAAVIAPSNSASSFEKRMVAEMQFAPVRGEADVVESKPFRSEIEVEPVRAEMQVIPTRHNLDLDDEERARIEVVLSAVRVSGIAFSIGAIWWAARAAGLVASLISSAPAWRHVDPLPVLGRDDEDEEEYDVAEEDQDRKDDEHRAAWVLEEREASS